ncbi:hypothetical protein GJV07_21990 [Enterobacteriaceae bacterium RIT711]|nr:hypothetical protein [Enterobacteriaceae bacterium RIT711]
MEENQIGLWGVIEMINKHGVDIKVGGVYAISVGFHDYRMFCCIAENKDGTFKCYNYESKYEGDYEAEFLHGYKYFKSDDITRAAEYGNGHQYMIEQTLKHYEGEMRERVKTEVEVNFQMQVHLNRDAFTKLNSASRRLEESGHIWNAESEMWVKL